MGTVRLQLSRRCLTTDAEARRPNIQNSSQTQTQTAEAWLGNGLDAVDTLPPEGSLLFFSFLFGFEFILNGKCLDGEVDWRKDAKEKNPFFFSCTTQN